MNISNLVTTAPEHGCVSTRTPEKILIEDMDSFEVMSPLTQSPASSHRTERSGAVAPMTWQLEGSLAAKEQNSALVKKPFFCTRCLTGFSTKGNLNVHLRTVHFTTYDFRCSNCDGQFSTKASLIRHVKMVHFRERPYRCPHCSSSFATKACVKRHAERRH